MEREEPVENEVKTPIVNEDNHSKLGDNVSEHNSSAKFHERTCSTNDYNFLTQNIDAESERNSNIRDLDSISQGNAAYSETLTKRRDRKSMISIGENHANKELELTIESFKEKLTKTEAHFKEKSESFRVLKLSSEKEKAILSQKIEFLELQLSECKNQLQESRNSNELLMKAMENSSTQEQTKSEAKLYNELKILHQNEIKSIENETEIAKKRYLAQIENLKEKNSELEGLHKQLTAQKERDLEIIKEEIIKSDKERITAEEKLRVFENEKANYIKINEEGYKRKISDLESQLEAEKQGNRQELNEFHSKYEDSLAQLREFYENERVRLEKRVSAEKEKWQKRLNQVTDEYENRISNDTTYYEEEIMGLKRELESKIEDANCSSNNLESNIKEKSKRLESLEYQFKDLKEKNEKLQQSLDSQVKALKDEKEAMTNRISTLLQENKEQEKELYVLGNKYENSENTIKCYQEKIEELQKRLHSTKLELENENANLRTKFESLNEESKNSKFNLERDLALKDQQINFLQQRSEEMQRKVSLLNDESVKKLAETKSELMVENEKRLKNALDENSKLSNRARELETLNQNLHDKLNQKTLEFEEEKNILKYHNDKLDREVRELEKCLDEETNGLKENLSKAKESYNNEKSNLINELDKYRSLYAQIEGEKSDLLTSYERDKALWMGKFNFLEEQKEQAKRDLADALKKFELTLQHMKRARNSEKDEQESNMNELIITIEKKYQNQIQEMQSNYNKTLNEYEDRTKKLEKELKSNQEKLASHQNRLNTSFMEELKLSETLERERKLKSDYEIALEEKEIKLSEYKKLIESEREAFRSKLSEMDQKYRDSENKRTGLLFEYEKEKALWKYERETLISEKNELLEDVRKMERGRDSSMLRDNETRSKKSISVKKVLNTSGIAVNTPGSYSRGKTYKNEHQKKSFFTNFNEKESGGENNPYDKGLSSSYMDSSALREKYR